MKVIISNTVALNGGDAAILQAIVDALSDELGKDTRFTVFDSQPETARRYYPDFDFQKLLYLKVARSPSGLGPIVRPLQMRRFETAAKLWGRGQKSAAKLLLSRAEVEALQTYAEADLIISTGGTYLVENYDIEPRLFDYRIALALGRPLVFYTQSLGPFREPQNQQRVRDIFNQASLVLLRDARSKHHLLEIGVSPDNLHVCADAVFALDVGPKPATPAREGADTISDTTDNTRRPKVAVSVRHWSHFENLSTDEGMKRYCDAIAAGVTHLVEHHQADVTFISTCQGIPEYWTHDSKTAHAIVDTLPDAVRKHVNVDDAFHPPQDLVKTLAAFDAVIATRMHMAILALIAGTAVLPVSYEFKTTELFERMGAGQWVEDINTIDADAFVQKIDALLADLPGVKALLAKGVAEQREIALEGARKVKKLVAS
ncbi:polysaccharide pyruvyl transferase [Lujinxingia vulgaris]|uniref:Polysaccharide pyruvyl transferase n=1 Tax=Lujinxingia vulgaris TaxID=2600176 RepID=A0A5C6X7C2_9DELT|nr:polysaccharide pyruvyl transferase family protein [Lujinxingia vulgaris]TXD35001.1 polysaccharide pyruvyl transferase [Lujinxingia vulgaris]